MPLPADGQDRVTQKIKEHLMQFNSGVRPLSRDFSRGLQFGTVVQDETDGRGEILEAIRTRMGSEAPAESDLFYLGAVIGSLIVREIKR
ncbi:hypothetical protein KC992_00145 [Candidatus Saccharibacteria bacterium]|nr:hypothetical protein [Candidatus Saccharibacteria bacterium]